jgi:uncharacterized protein
MMSYETLLLCVAAFSAGFVDSIVGGGGLIQLPALLMFFPNLPVVTLLGTNKLISVSGTAFSAYRYTRQIKLLPQIIFPCMISAFIFSFLGAHAVGFVPNDLLRPIFIGLMLFIFVLTIRNKHFGMQDHRFELIVPLWKPLIIGSILGFYDGFFGPGMGTLLILAFVGMLQMTFVQGSAYAKMINLTTNVAAILLFILKGTILWETALIMMVFNVSGAFFGVRMALLRGNEFVRGLLRFVIFVTILKAGWEVFRDLGH